jgi:uncharacterized protein (DUF2147 family)
MDAEFLAPREKTMKKLTLALLIGLAPFAAQAADLKGIWLTEEGKARVSFEPCSSKFCGKIIWLKEPNDETGKPLVDALNQNKSLRTRPIIGLQLTELASDGNGGWKGRIYNPEDGKSYAAEAEVQNNGALLIKGCALGGLICDGQTWTRAK